MARALKLGQVAGRPLDDAEEAVLAAMVAAAEGGSVGAATVVSTMLTSRRRRADEELERRRSARAAGAKSRQWLRMSEVQYLREMHQIYMSAASGEVGIARIQALRAAQATRALLDGIAARQVTGAELTDREAVLAVLREMPPALLRDALKGREDE